MSFLGFEDPAETDLTFATSRDLESRGGSFLSSLGEIYMRNAEGMAQDTVGAGAVSDWRAGRLGRAYRAAVDQALYVENGLARSAALEEATTRRIRSIAEATGVTLENPEGDGYRREARARLRTRVAEGLQAGESGGESDGLVGEQRRIFAEKLAELEKSFPDKAGIIRAQVALEDDARELSRAADKEFNAANAAVKNPIAGLAATFAGGGVGFVQDPINVGSLFFGAKESRAASVAWRIGETALREAFINAAATALIQPEVQRYRAELGLEAGLGPALENIGFAGLFGGLFGGAFRGLVELRPKAERVLAGRASPAEVRQVLDAAGVRLSPDDDQVLAHAARVAGDDAGMPPAPAGIDARSHADTLIDAVRHAEDPLSEPPPSPPVLAPRPRADRPTLADRAPLEGEAPAPASDRFTYDGKPVARETFDPRALTTDAATFQYKGGGDEAGVTTRLRSVGKWDPLAAGNVIVFERLDGTRVVADGHQRTGLARRLAAQGDAAAESIGGFLFREADGWTPADVRAIAAKKNIQEGSGSLLDTARVLRDRPDLWDATLPVTDDRLTKARALSQLSDEAWGAVVNGVIDPLYASHIAAQAPSPHWHAALVREIVDADPPNEAAARFIIADALSAGLAHEVQETMFGMMETAASLRRERAGVFDAARKMLAQEKRLFATLEARADEIAAAGNALNRETNRTKAQKAGALVQLVEKLATRAGPVSDALNRAAIAVREGQARNRAAATFVADLADLVEREGLAGLEAPPQLAPAKAIEPGSAEVATQADELLGPGLFDENPPGASQTAAEASGRAEGAATSSDRPQRPRQAIVTPAELLIEFKDGQRGLTYDELYARAATLQNTLNVHAFDVQKETGARYKMAKENNGLKDKAEGFAKIARKDYEGPHELTDLARGSFIVDTPDQAEAVAAALGRRFEILDEGWKTGPSGYTDRKLLIRGSDGTVAEVQIIPAAMLEAKGAKGGHRLYKRERQLSPGPEKDRLIEWQREIYSAAADELGAPWAAILGRVDSSSGPNVPSNLARQAASDMTPAVENTSSASTGFQGADGRVTANASSGASNSTAGRLSQSQNVGDFDMGSSKPDIAGANEIRNDATPAGAADGESILSRLDPASQSAVREALVAADRINGLGDLVAACKV